MDRTARACVRLLAALEDLVAQEAACLAAGDLDAIAAIQAKAEPVVEYLGREGAAISADPGWRARLAACLKLRRETAVALAQMAAETKSKIDRLHTGRRVLTQLVPADREPRSTARRFFAVG